MKISKISYIFERKYRIYIRYISMIYWQYISSQPCVLHIQWLSECEDVKWDLWIMAAECHYSHYKWLIQWNELRSFKCKSLTLTIKLRLILCLTSDTIIQSAAVRYQPANITISKHHRTFRYLSVNVWNQTMNEPKQTWTGCPVRLFDLI